MKLNKDGTPRKQGSGRTKGSTSFVTFSLKQLIELLPEGAEIVASRKWAEALAIKNKSQPYSVIQTKAAAPDSTAAPKVEEETPAIQVNEVSFDED